MTIRVRPLTETEAHEIQRLARSRTEPARRVERAKIIRLSTAGKSPPQISKTLKLGAGRVRDWVQRFNAEGLAGLQDQPRSGAPRTYNEATVGVIVVSALTDPQTLGLPFNAWTLDRLATYLHEQKGVQMKRSRIGDILVAEGLRWRQQEKWFGERVDPQFAEKRGTLRSCTPPRPRRV
jgi:transposase